MEGIFVLKGRSAKQSKKLCLFFLLDGVLQRFVDVFFSNNVSKTPSIATDLKELLQLNTCVAYFD